MGDWAHQDHHARSTCWVSDTETQERHSGSNTAARGGALACALIEPTFVKECRMLGGIVNFFGNNLKALICATQNNTTQLCSTAWFSCQADGGLCCSYIFFSYLFIFSKSLKCYLLKEELCWNETQSFSGARNTLLQYAELPVRLIFTVY